MKSAMRTRSGQAKNVDVRELKGWSTSHREATGERGRGERETGNEKG